MNQRFGVIAIVKLSVGSTTSDELAVLGELGRSPLAIHYKLRCIKYLLLKLADQRMPKACYKMLKNLDENGRKTWANDVKLLLQTFGFIFVWMQQGVGDESVFLEVFYSRLTNYYLEKWTQESCHQTRVLE